MENCTIYIFLINNLFCWQAASDKEKGAAGKAAAKGGKDKPKSGGKKGKGGKTPEPPSIKGGTKLKKRGEEDEKVYIGMIFRDDSLYCCDIQS